MNAPKIFRIAGLQQVVTFAVTFGTSIAIARMLSPQQIGTFSVAMAAIVAADVMKAAGIGTYLLKEQELNPSKIGNAHGLAIAFAWSLAALVFLLRWPIADFYKSPEMADILLLVSIGYLLIPLQSVAMGLLVRDLRFGSTAIINVLSAVANAAVSIGLVRLGYGAMALACGALASTVLTTLLALLARPAQLVLRPRFGHWRGIWSDSLWIIGSGVLNQAGYRSSELVLGRFLSVADAALYDRAMLLPRMLWVNLSAPIFSVLAPIFAHEMRGGVEVGKSTLARMRFFAAIFSPIMAGLGTQAEPVVLLLYGSQWDPSVAPAFWLCLNSAVTGHFVVITSALLAMGRVKELFWINLLDQCMNLAIILTFASTNLRTLAMAMMVPAIAFCVWATVIGVKVKLFAVRQLVSALLAPVALTVIVFLVGFAMDAILSRLGQPLLARLLLSSLALALAWIGGAMLIVPEVVGAMRRLVKL